MIDPATEELLSRYLDDDLEGEDLRSLEQRLSIEPELAETLEGLRGVQTGLSELAAAMEPPASLDALMKPLRRGHSTAPSRHTWFVLLSAAACLVIAVTVVNEMRHSGPGQESPGSPPQVAVGPGANEGYYQLQPLPSAQPNSEVLGAADRLLNSPDAEPELPKAETEVLHVYGPLSAEEVAENRRDGAEGVARPEDQEVSRQHRTSRAAEGFAPAPAAVAKKTAGLTASKAQALHLALEVAGTVTAVDESLSSTVAEGRYPLRITVADGRITHCVSHSPQPDAAGPEICRVVSLMQVPSLKRGTIDATAVVSAVAP